MSTTLLYVELIIIGLECSIWIFLGIVNLTSLNMVIIAGKLLDKSPVAIFIFGIFYILGIIMDRLVDLFFKNAECEERKRVKLESPTSMFLWDKDQKKDFFHFSRSKIRILRASILNIPLITIMAFIFIYKYITSSFGIYIFVLILGTSLTVISYKGYLQMLKNFYKKAKIIEEINKTRYQSAS